MSFVRPEDRKQLLKLGGAVVAVFGCAAWRVVGATAPAAPPSATAESAPATDSGSAPADEAAAKPPEGTIEIPKLFTVSTIDPFRTIAPARLPSRPIPAPPAMPSGPLTVLPVPTAGPAPIPAPASIPGVEATMRVTGIVAGPNATAIVEIDKETRVVREGTTLADGSTIVRIDPTAVTIRRGKETRTLEVGD